MEAVKSQLGIGQEVTTYAARHSFATRLMRKGASTSFIKDSLGHSSVTVTENYLAAFDDAVKEEYANALTQF